MAKVIAAGITNWPADEVALVGSRCDDCGVSAFPSQRWCPSCCGANVSDILLPRAGTVVTWTIQAFYPGPGYVTAPEDFEPFAMGLVQLDDVIRVEARLTETDPAKLDFGMRVELTMVPVGTDADGEEILTFAFAPV